MSYLFCLQACIDDNVDMVTFLVEHGACINQPDNEGWIPLHAAASCGYMDIAEYVLYSPYYSLAILLETPTYFFYFLYFLYFLAILCFTLYQKHNIRC